MWKITSPLNFPSDKHIKHGSVKYEYTLPKWAKNNPRIVIEQVDIIEKPEENEKEIEREIKEEQIEFEEISYEDPFCCLTCERRFTSEEDLQEHFKKAHLYSKLNQNKEK